MERAGTGQGGYFHRNSPRAFGVLTVLLLLLAAVAGTGWSFLAQDRVHGSPAAVPAAAAPAARGYVPPDVASPSHFSVAGTGLCLPGVPGWACQAANILGVSPCYSLLSEMASGLGHELCGQASTGGPTQAYDEWVQMVIASNGFQASSIDASNQANWLNVSRNGWGYYAATAAELQLGNATFNPLLDLAQSTIAQQLQTTLTSQQVWNQRVVQNAETWWIQTEGSGGLFASTATKLGFDCFLAGCANFNDAALTPTYWGTDFESTSSKIFYAYVDPAFGGSPSLILYCQHTGGCTGGNLTVRSVDGSADLGSAQSLIKLTFPTTADDVGSRVGFALAHGDTLAINTTNLTSFIGSGNALLLTNYSVPVGPEPAGVGQLEGSWTPAGGAAALGGSLQGGNVTTQIDQTWAATNLPSIIQLLEQQASVSGYAYWAALRALGFSSVSQIPSNCLIPPPSTLLPPGLNFGSLNYTDAEQLYLEYLAALGATYSASVQNLTVCGAHPHLNLGNWTTSNLSVDLTGSIYIGNKTQFSIEFYGNPATWLYKTQQIGFIVPIGAIKFPVNSTFNLPFGLLFYAWLPNNLTLITLHGNGTTGMQCATNHSSYACGSGTSPPTNWPRFSVNDSVFLYNCSISTSNTIAGVTTSHYLTTTTGCIEGVEQLNQTAPNPAGTGPPPSLFFGTCGQSIAIWATVVGAWSTVTGTSALGCLAAEALALITILVVAVVVVWLAAGVIESRRH